LIVFFLLALKEGVEVSCSSFGLFAHRLDVVDVIEMKEGEEFLRIAFNFHAYVIID
jgi:hypothetical protein